MFAIMPRVVDEVECTSFSNMFDQIMEPVFASRHAWPVQYHDGTHGHITRGRLGNSQVENTDKEFRIRLSLSHYRPEEIKITSDNQTITVQAKHEERQDSHGSITREMKRVYKLPKDVDPQSATSTMNGNGTLFIKLTKTDIEGPKDTNIPIEYKNDA